MEIEMENKILRAVAEGDSLDYTIWPDLLPRLITRLEQILHSDFPIPLLNHLPSSHFASSPQAIQLQVAGPSVSEDKVVTQKASVFSQSIDKENASPTSLETTNSGSISEDSLPPRILSLFNSIKQTLTTYFSQYPPHTIQRLSELILAPKEYYRSLASYLHAVDRVVHVTSGANIYPLPAAFQDPQALPSCEGSGADLSSISWGTSTHILPSLGSDESLGGALLTPIPWLRPQSHLVTSAGNGSKHVKELEGEVKTESTETIDGPYGAGSIETVSISVNGIQSTISPSSLSNENRGNLRAEGGVTQGELLRQEQRAGVVPATQVANARNSSDVDSLSNDDDETPHARGPEEIGMEDMGPQVAGSVGIGMQGIDVEAAVGRKAEGKDHGKHEEPQAPLTPKREAADGMESDSKRLKDSSSSDSGQLVEDETMTLASTDGKFHSET